MNRVSELYGKGEDFRAGIRVEQSPELVEKNRKIQEAVERISQEKSALSEMPVVQQERY